jgi:nitrogen regulatory protein P-II 1
MKKIEATIKPFKLDEVRDALVALGVEGMSVAEVQTLDPKAHSAHYRGTEYIVWFTPQYRLDIVVRDELVSPCIEAIRHCARTKDPDCGAIVVLPVDDSVRIRTGDHLRRAA